MSRIEIKVTVNHVTKIHEVVFADPMPFKLETFISRLQSLLVWLKSNRVKE